MTFQRNRLLTLLLNYDDALKNEELALNSAGVATKKFEIYQESAQAKVDNLKASIEGLFQSLIQSDALKSIIVGMSNFVQWVTEANLVIPVMAGIIAGIGVASISSFIAGITALNGALTITNVLMGGLPLIIGAIVTVTAGLGINIAKTNTEFKKNAEYVGSTVKAYSQLKQEIDSINKKHEESKKQITDDNKSLSDNLAIFEELSQKQSRNIYEKQKLIDVVDSLNKSIPELNLKYNEESDILEGQISTIRELVEQKKKLSEVQQKEQELQDKIGIDVDLEKT